MNKAKPGIWIGQKLHLFSLIVLLLVSYYFWNSFGRPEPLLFWVAVLIPVDHQVFVWLAWRLELRNSSTSRMLGFRVYLVLFFVLFFGRFVSLFILAWVDQGTLGMDEVLVKTVTAILVIPGLYAAYSVKRYFGMERAAGADHFDRKYREMPLVKQGIFRFTNNAMYWWAFLLFWAIAVGLNSSAALVVAAFSHIYIWVHFYATEKPDMEFLYGNEQDDD